MINEPLALAETGIGSIGYWTSAITEARANIQNIATQRNWDDNLKAYLGQGNRQRYGKNTTLIRKDYSLTEIKKALLFFQTPDVSAEAQDPDFEPAAPLVGAVVNKYLSADYTNAMAMVDE